MRGWGWTRRLNPFAPGTGPLPSADSPDDGPPIPADSYWLAAALFASIAATNILTPLLPQVRDDLGISIAMAGIVVATYGLARLFIDLPSGFVVERIGEGRLAWLGLVLLTSSSMGGAVAPNVEWLIAARVGAGLGSGVLTTVILTALSSTAPDHSRGQVMSLYQIANNVGIAFYPLVGGILGTLFGWRSTFLFTALAALACGAILIPVLRRVDTTLAGRKGGSRAAPRVAPLVGWPLRRALGAIYFGVTVNMVNRHGFRNTVLPLYAAASIGLGSISIATGIAVMSIVGIIVVTPGARIGDRIGRRPLLVRGLAILAVGDLAFLLTGDYITFILAAVLLGTGDFFSSSQTALLSEVVPAERRPRVLSGYRFFVDLGALIGPIMLAGLMDLFGAGSAILVASALLATGSLVARIGIPDSVGVFRPESASGGNAR